METEISQEEQDSFFENGEAVWERTKKIYELVDNFYKNEKENNNRGEKGYKQLTELYNEIRELKKQKDDLIRVSIGYMYNGVLVGGDISCRKGKVYRFRCQYSLNNKQIKKSIMKNLIEVEKKLSEPNMDILEIMLEMIEDDEGYNNNNNRDENVVLDLNNFRIAEFKDDGVEFQVISKIKLEESGEIRLENENQRNVNLDSYSEMMLKAKLKSELDNLATNFIVSQEEKRNSLIKEVDTIKDKAKNLLMLREIDRGSENA